MEINTRILNIDNKEDEKILRKKVADFDFSKYSKNDIRELIATMRKVMDEANGMGLAANQIGLDMAVFIAKVDGKFYAVFNPEIKKISSEKTRWEGEGCLSVTNQTDVSYSHSKFVLEGMDRNGRKLKIKAWGLLALTFQHEVDHLNGKLFIDRRREKDLEK